MLSLATAAILVLGAPPPLTLRCPPDTTPRVERHEGAQLQWCAAAGGLREGPWVRRDAQGQVLTRMSYRAGRREGLYERFYSNGKPKARGRYEAGARVGVWRLWDASGWQRAGPVVADRPEGVWRVLDADGAVRAEGAYLKGARDGAWTWTLEGGAKQTGTYSGGRLSACEGTCPMLQPQAEIEEAFALTAEARRACYRAAKAIRPTLALNFELGWTVGVDGRVKDLRLGAGAPPPGALRDCIGASLSTLRLPSPAREVPTKRQIVVRPTSNFSDEMHTEGRCLTKDLRPVINPGRGALLRCVKRAHAWPPPRPGRVQLQWSIGADGRVGAVRVRPDEDPELVRCLQEPVRGWRFTPGEGCEVTYTVKWD